VKLRLVKWEAVVVRRIYTEFARGVSAAKIARALNQERAPASRAMNSDRHKPSSWTSRRIHEILRRELYRGKVLSWRREMVRDPGTGRLVTLRLSEDEVVCVSSPELTIVSAGVADAIATTRIYDHRKTRPEDSPTFKITY
jgi:hypothetical protein